MFYLFLVIGLLIRLMLIPLAGFKADVAFWKGWGLAASDKGVLWMMTNTNYNYPPGFSYVLWFINKVYALFKDPHNINEYWADNNIFYLFLIKLITIAADLMIVWLIIKITKQLEIRSWKLEERKTSNIKPQTSNIGKYAKVFALFYFLNPAVIYDGVVWGQVDQFGLALFLASVYLLFIGKAKWASAIFTISCLMKFQNIIFIPLFYLMIFKKYSFKELVSSLAVSFLAFLIVTLPFFLGKQTERLIWLLTINSDWFPWYSLNAFNAWWIASGLKGMQLNDKHLVLGITSAKQMGLYLFIFTYFVSTIAVLFSKKESLFRNFLLACTLAIFAFFHLLTQSHERYLYPAVGLLLLLFLLDFKENLSHKAKMEDGRWKMDFLFFSIFYFLTSIFFFLNMYLSMGWNYPDQVIPSFTRDQTLGLSLVISLIQIILFIIFVVWAIGQIKQIRLIGIIGLVIIAALFIKNLSYFLNRPVELTWLKPISYRQDYLEPVYNKTVESARGVKFWNRLSVNYYFYDQGIGSHAESDITYHLARGFLKFTTDFGIDTEADQSAKVYFSILGDGRELFTSEPKGRFDKPGTTIVDVRGVNYLTLRITKAGESNFGAHADWLDPELIR